MHTNIVFARVDNDIVHGICTTSSRDVHTMCGCTIDRYNAKYTELGVNKHTRITCMRCLAKMKKTLFLPDHQIPAGRLMGKDDNPTSATTETLKNMDSGVIHAVRPAGSNRGFRYTMCGVGISKHNHTFGDSHYDQEVTCERCLAAMSEPLGPKLTKIQKPMSDYYYEVHDLDGLVEDVFADTVDKAVEKYCHDFGKEERDIEYILLIEIATKYVPKYHVEWVKE